jgi:phage terminase small subunit
MPVLSNPKHERFAQELAKGKTADEAYQLAGCKPNRVCVPKTLSQLLM